MRQRLITFAVFGIILVAVGEWGMRSGRFSRLDALWLEFCVGNAGDRIGSPAVTLVRIDDGYEPLRIGGDENAPADGSLSRLDYATILAFVSKFSPRSVAFLPTPRFDESLMLNKTDIAPLKDAAMKLPKFVAASTISNDGEEAKETAPLDYPELKVEGDASSLLPYTRTVRYPDPQILANGIPAFRSLESARGLVSDTELRVPLVARRGDRVAPSLVLAAVANHAGVPLGDIVVKLDDGRPRILVGELRPIPIGADGTFSVPSRAGLRPSMTRRLRDESGTLTEVYQAASLTVDELAYTGEETDEVARRILAELRTRFDSLGENLVLVGFDRAADRRIASPTGEALSETGLLARAVAAIQSGRYIGWWPAWGRWLALAAIVAIAIALFRLPRFKFVPAVFVAALAFFAAKVLVFSATLAWTPPFFAFSLFGLMFLVGLLVPAQPARSKA